MQIQPKQPTTKGSADRFVGEVWLDAILAEDTVATR